MNSDILIGYLSYVTEQNKSYRLNHFNKSIDSFQSLVNNFDCICIDNNSTQEVKNHLIVCDFINHFFLRENFYDIALFYITLWEAKRLNKRYVLFTYDDFIYSDESVSMLKSVETFMNENPDVGCTRVCAYSLTNKEKYDCDYISKSINPDSVRNYNTYTGKHLTWSDIIKINNHKFSKTSWHYTSRPTFWRVDVFEKMLRGIEDIPIMQYFEAAMCKKFDAQKLLTGVLDVGMMKTTPTSDSVRVRELRIINNNDLEKITVSIRDLQHAYESSRV